MRISASTLLAGAALALAGAAQAQSPASSVQLNGLVDASVGRVQAAPGATAENAVESGRMSTSWFGVQGREDIGGGVQAMFQVESFLRLDTGTAGRFNGDAFWARNALVGLTGGFGTVTAGRVTTALFVNTLLFNAFGDSFGFSPSIRHTFTSGTVTGDTGWNDSVRYTSPNFGGAQLGAHVAAGEGNGGRNVGVDGRWFSGPFAAGFAWQRVKKGAAVDDSTAWQLGGSWDLSAVKLFAQVGKVNNDTNAAVTGFAGATNWRLIELGAAIPAGPGKVLLQAGRLDPNVGDTRSTYSGGYDYFVSKRTDLYAVAMAERQSGLSSTNWAVGMRHRF